MLTNPSLSIDVSALTEVLSIPRFWGLTLAPSGQALAYVRVECDWKADRYRNAICLHDLDRAAPPQVIPDAFSPAFDPEGQLLFLQAGQLHRRSPEGTIQRLSNISGAIRRFWPYQGNEAGVLVIASASHGTEERPWLTHATHVDFEPRDHELYFLPSRVSDTAPLLAVPCLTETLPPALRIKEVLTLPQGYLVANCQRGTDYDAVETHVARWQPDMAPDSICWQRAPLPSFAAIVAVSPDGQRLLLNHEPDRRGFSNEPYQLWTCSVDAVLEGQQPLAINPVPHLPDQQLHAVRWTAAGISFRYPQSCAFGLGLISSTGGFSSLQPPRPTVLEYAISPSEALAAIAAGPEQLPGLYYSKTGNMTWTSIHEPAAPWPAGSLGTSEVIQWRTSDGHTIEGVLRKPPGFASSRRYPLAVMLHGGPACNYLHMALDYDDQMIYPTPAFLAKGILVLKVNYRGSSGRGKAFEQANRQEMGRGEIRDIEAGIASLVQAGLVDPDHVGVMGWSHGGYLAACMAAWSTQASAISVGAGVSCWRNYTLTSDFHRFPELWGPSPLLDARPADAASPALHLDQARTPTLIQHGLSDRIVHPIHAWDLYRSLQARGVPATLFTFGGRGHGVPWESPRAAQAVLLQNLHWFQHHLLGEALPWSMSARLPAGEDN